MSAPGPRGATALGAAAIMVAGAVMGLVFNHFATQPMALWASEASLRPPVAANVAYVDLHQARAMFDAGMAVFVDARTPEEFAEGHIPGALNLPQDDYERARAALGAHLTQAPAIIVYCEGLTCERSAEVANRLAADEAAPVHLMFSGWEEWRAAGFPVE